MIRTFFVSLHLKDRRQHTRENAHDDAQFGWLQSGVLARGERRPLAATCFVAVASPSAPISASSALGGAVP